MRHTIPILMQYLFGGVCEANLPKILCALAHGGNVNFVNEEKDSKTPVLQAVEMVS